MNEIWKQWEGQVVNGKFPLQKYLGGSGHGIVFLTERDGPSSPKAAIKLIVENPAQTEARLSLWARAGTLTHPNLLPIFESGRCQLGETALLYVVMDYAEEDLSQILPHRALAPAEAKELIPPVVKALAYLHSQGFVHGHLKPTNIMAIADQVKVSSDGLCAVAGSSGRWADYPGMDVYDPVYDPPEAEGGRLTPAADIWSFGVTLVESLTLRRRIWDRTGRGGKEAELILPEGIPDPFLDIVRHCLIPDPEQRCTAAEMAARLEGRAFAPKRPENGRSKAGRSGQNGSAANFAKKSSPAKWFYPAIIVIGVLLVMMVAARMRHPALPPLPAGPAQPASQAQNEATQPVTAAPEQPPARAAAKAETPAVASPAHSGGIVRGAVLRQVLPEVSQRARGSIEGHVRVKVKVAVDAAGNVASATLDSSGPSKYFARQALQAAQAWKFTPAQRDGQQVPSEWMLKFSFSLAGADVEPLQVKP
jgi:TonB family protein